MINIVIYSKDRAMQLFALQYSLMHNCLPLVNKAKTTVIYKASNEEFEKGYDKVKEISDRSTKLINAPVVSYVSETDFKQDTLNAIDLNNKYTMFLMDDIVFYNVCNLEDEPFAYLDKYPDGVLAVSLRLSSQTNYCYPTSKEQKVPSFHKKCAWQWIEADGDFGYPMSLDGNVFNTNKLLEILHRIPDDKFVHPNLLEGALNDFAQSRKYTGTIPQVMTCYPEASRLFNNPCNRVQDVVQNKNESSYSAKDLNDIWLKTPNARIDMHKTLDDIEQGKIIVNAAHFPISLVIDYE